MASMLTGLINAFIIRPDDARRSESVLQDCMRLSQKSRAEIAFQGTVVLSTLKISVMVPKRYVETLNYFIGSHSFVVGTFLTGTSYK